jgi:cytochrome P450
MPVTDLEMTMLRAQLAGDDEAARHAFTAQLARSGDASGLGMLLYAAFVIAARRKFAPRWSRTDVIGYVARVRALLSERPDLLDPVTAEDELHSALGGNVMAEHDTGARAAAWLILLLALAASLDLDDDATQVLLDEARGQADQMLAAACS